MDVNQFIDKWSRADRTERQAAQEHFIDLCRVLGEPTPNEAADPDSYSVREGRLQDRRQQRLRRRLEARLLRLGVQEGQRQPRPRLSAAPALFGRAGESAAAGRLRHQALPHLHQLDQHGSGQARLHAGGPRRIPETRELLHNVFRQSRPAQAGQDPRAGHQGSGEGVLTIAERLRMAGHAPEKVAHFLNRLVFCLFAEDVNLLQDDLFKRLLDTLAKRREQVPERSQRMLSELFARDARRRQIRARTHPAFQRRPVRRRRGAAARRRLRSTSCATSRGRTGRRSTPRSSARCSSASSIPTSARRSAPTTPIPKRS